MDLVALTFSLFFLYLSFSPVAWTRQFAWDLTWPNEHWSHLLKDPFLNSYHFALRGFESVSDVLVFVARQLHNKMGFMTSSSHCTHRWPGTLGLSFWGFHQSTLYHADKYKATLFMTRAWFCVLEPVELCIFIGPESDHWLCLSVTP